MFGLTYNSFYKRLHSSNYPNYPKLHFNKQNRAFLYLAECLEPAKQEADFKEKYISLVTASRLLFGSKTGIRDLKRRGKDFNFLSMHKINGKYFFLKEEFDKFYKETCSSKRLIKLTRIQGAVGLGNTPIFYDILRQSGFYEKVRFFQFNAGGNKFYNLVDVNRWLSELKIRPIVL